ncbi:hypothetical protein [Pseudonocardia sediminis]|uniref:hypothetical protein n=1 Tax=Pseudonocardia sediminis TaxID=1397368 RepID=UPI0013EF2048|nr:hypothetical protein [Pseudonocardia sediminis]
MTSDVAPDRPHKIDITDAVGGGTLRADTLDRVTGAGEFATIDRFPLPTRPASEA